jgi:hypothetical protein
MTAITKREASQLVEKYDASQVFTVTFVKRTTGETRVINCRKGVKKHLKGGRLGYNPAEKSLVGVFDMQNGGYRMIALESIKKIVMQGEEYKVV